MSVVDDDASASTETDRFVEFHVQPYSLSIGYESISDRTGLGRDYQANRLQRKFRNVSCFSRYKRSLGQWREYKKPLDERRLSQAVSMNDTNTVVHLLNHGVSPCCHDVHRRTPLHLAACKGYVHIVQILLDYGADPNARDSIGNTPLHVAACTNHINVITLLLKAGTDANSIDRLGRNPLQLAQSKLRILQKNSADSGKHMKEQVNQVIEMLLMFSNKEEVSVDSSMLEMFQNNLKLASDSREQVDTHLNQLLDNLSTLNIDSNNK